MIYDNIDAEELDAAFTRINQRSADALTEIRHAETNHDRPDHTEAVDALIEINAALLDALPAARSVVEDPESLENELSQHTPSSKENRRLRHDIRDLIERIREKPEDYPPQYVMDELEEIMADDTYIRRF